LTCVIVATPLEAQLSLSRQGFAAVDESRFSEYANPRIILELSRRTAIAKRTFGSYIVEKRRERGISQKDLASRVKRDDGVAISPTYLNDIEHDRRSPTAHHMIEQLAVVLELDIPYLSYLAGQYPSEVSGKKRVPEEVFSAAWQAFRQTLGDRKSSKKT
jgi:transcriptional regulator with XRE-family HTH domain